MLSQSACSCLAVQGPTAAPTVLPTRPTALPTKQPTKAPTRVRITHSVDTPRRKTCSPALTAACPSCLCLPGPHEGSDPLPELPAHHRPDRVPDCGERSHALLAERPDNYMT